MCVCVHIYVCRHMCLGCMYMCMHIHTYICVCACMCMCLCMYMYGVHVYVHVCPCMCVYMCVHACFYVSTCVHVSWLESKWPPKSHRSSTIRRSVFVGVAVPLLVEVCKVGAGFKNLTSSGLASVLLLLPDATCCI